MNKDKVIKEYMGSLGAIGGKSRSKAKLEALKLNLAKANATKAKIFADAKKAKA